ncbi:MAG: tetratricopeptide repeat protein [Candidatus Omnitrophica bacterium]|nr:tetratricopeptide repeat protein [Candidatus Omnitrophota bacterium]
MGQIKEDPRTLSIAHIAIIAVLGFIIYANSFGNQFLYDDDRLIVDNIYVKNLSYLPKVFTQDIGAGANFSYSFYRPVQIFTYMIDYFLWGLSVFGYHLTNTIMHILVGIFIYIFISSLFKNTRAGFFTSILFMVHPVHVEAVAYISGRADVLAGLGIAAFFTFYIKYLDSNKTAFFVLSAACYVLSLLSKEYAIILPFLLCLYHYVFKYKIKVVPACVIGAITALYITLRLTVFSFPLSEPVIPQPFTERLAGFFAAIFQYARIIFFPFGLHMEYGKRTFGLTDPMVLAGVIILAFFLLYVYVTRNEKPIFFLLGWFCLCMLPVSNLYPINAYMAEHWLYVPSIGLFGVVGYFLAKLSDINGFKITAFSVLGLVAIFFGYLTITQNVYWKDPITFYERTLKYTDAARIYNNLGNMYADMGDYEKSIGSYKKAIESDPQYTGAYSNLGNLYNKLGKLQDAVEIYKKAIAVNPRFADAYNNLGTAYDALGDHEAAMNAYRQALEIRPNYSETYSNMGNISYRLGHFDEAARLYKKAVDINPYNAIGYYNLSKAYRKLGQEQAADEAYGIAKELNPNLP